MKQIIKKILIQESENSKIKLLKLIYHKGVFATAQLVGGYDKLIELTGNEIPSDLKIQDIKEILDKEGGLHLGELDFEEPIFIKNSDGEIHQIEYLGINKATIQVWGGYKFSNDEGEYKVSYESLEDNTIEEICGLIYNSFFN